MSDLTPQDPIISRTSEAKREANHSNAQKSTGPKTEQGKRNASRNAVKHGIFSRVVVGDSEDEKLYNELVQKLCDEFAPEGVREQIALERAIVCLWRSQRAVKYETEQNQSREKAGLRQQLGGTMHYEAHLQRAYKEAIQELERLQEQRTAKEVSDDVTR